MHLQSSPCRTSPILNLQIQLAKHVVFGAKLGLRHTPVQIAQTEMQSLHHNLGPNCQTQNLQVSDLALFC